MNIKLTSSTTDCYLKSNFFQDGKYSKKWVYSGRNAKAVHISVSYRRSSEERLGRADLINNITIEGSSN